MSNSKWIIKPGSVIDYVVRKRTSKRRRYFSAGDQQYAYLNPYYNIDDDENDFSIISDDSCCSSISLTSNESNDWLDKSINCFEDTTLSNCEVKVVDVNQNNLTNGKATKKKRKKTKSKRNQSEATKDDENEQKHVNPNLKATISKQNKSNGIDHQASGESDKSFQNLHGNDCFIRALEKQNVKDYFAEESSAADEEESSGDESSDSVKESDGNESDNESDSDSESKLSSLSSPEIDMDDVETKSDVKSSCSSTDNYINTVSAVKIISITSTAAMVLIEPNEDVDVTTVNDFNLSTIGLTFGNVKIINLNREISLNGYQLKYQQSSVVSTGFGRYIIEITPVKPESTSTNPTVLDRKYLEKLFIERTKTMNVNKDERKKFFNAIDTLNDEFSSNLIIMYLEQINDHRLLALESILTNDIKLKEWFNFETIARNRLPIRNEWLKILDEQLIKNLTSKSKTLITGEKNSGKSSLLRWLCNYLLSNDKVNFKKILFVDCDPGQTEFSPSGCLSLILIDQPILSPSFVNVIFHGNKILTSTSVGNVDVSNNPDLYLNNFRLIWEKVSSIDGIDDIPIFINTMGWMKDIGLQLLMDIIQIVKPTDLIQIISSTKEMIKLEPEIINKLPRWSLDVGKKNVRNNLNSNKARKYNYIQLNNHGNIISSHAKQTRIYSQLAYMCCIDGFLYKTINSLTPIRLVISKLHFHIVNENSFIKKHLILDAINCSWVHLCHIYRDIDNENSSDSKMKRQLSTPLSPLPVGSNSSSSLFGEPVNGLNVLSDLDDNVCLGSGIVRTIDTHNDFIYILTPEPISSIEKINCIVKPNGIHTPDDIMFRQQLDDLDLKEMPYLSFMKL